MQGFSGLAGRTAPGLEPGVVGLLKRYRELILVVVLLVLPLGVYFAHAKHPSERSQLDRVILSVTGPIEKGVGWVVGGALGTWNGYVALRHAHRRALAAERELNLLRLDQMELDNVRQENERLRQLLAFSRETPGRSVLGARVIGVRLDPKGLQLVTIDRGADDGIARMMPAVAAQGVVGRVHAVAGSTADVLLLSDRNSSIAVRVDRSRARANVRGIGSPDTCRLEYALRSDDMLEGDLLVTSGTDGVFPRGLAVGKITGLKRSGQGLYQRADVTPSVDLTKLEEVLVLTSLERRASDAPRAAADPKSAAAAGAKR
jgi:rod shape-determining protein MreC